MSGKRDRVNKTLDALVDEAYQKALNAGIAITSPERWREWKRGIYIATAKRQGPGYLSHHHQRLGLGVAYPNGKKCSECGDGVVGEPIRRDDDDAPYCSLRCAGYEAITLTQWLENHATPEQKQAMMRFTKMRDDKGETA